MEAFVNGEECGEEEIERTKNVEGEQEEVEPAIVKLDKDNRPAIGDHLKLDYTPRVYDNTLQLRPPSKSHEHLTASLARMHEDEVQENKIQEEEEERVLSQLLHDCKVACLTNAKKQKQRQTQEGAKDANVDEDMDDEVRQEGEYSSGSTYFIRPNDIPTCALEKLAQSIFYSHVGNINNSNDNNKSTNGACTGYQSHQPYQHTRYDDTTRTAAGGEVGVNFNNCGYDVNKSGAEWWVVCIDKNDKDDSTECSIHDDDNDESRESDNNNNDDDDDSTVVNEVGFHWDRDYHLTDYGMNVHPHLATVTYLTPSTTTFSSLQFLPVNGNCNSPDTNNKSTRTTTNSRCNKDGNSSVSLNDINISKNNVDDHDKKDYCKRCGQQQQQQQLQQEQQLTTGKHVTFNLRNSNDYIRIQPTIVLPDCISPPFSSTIHNDQTIGEEKASTSTNSLANYSIQSVFGCIPSIGRHFVFDGRMLHAAPSLKIYPTPTSDTSCTSSSRCRTCECSCHYNNIVHDEQNKEQRITFLVNIWLNHIPCDAERIPSIIVGNLILQKFTNACSNDNCDVDDGGLKPIASPLLLSNYINKKGDDEKQYDLSCPSSVSSIIPKNKKQRRGINVANTMEGSEAALACTQSPQSKRWMWPIFVLPKNTTVPKSIVSGEGAATTTTTSDQQQHQSNASGENVTRLANTYIERSCNATSPTMTSMTRVKEWNFVDAGRNLVVTLPIPVFSGFYLNHEATNDLYCERTYIDFSSSNSATAAAAFHLTYVGDMADIARVSDAEPSTDDDDDDDDDDNENENKI